MSGDVERIANALADARALCDALGLLDGRIGRDWKRLPRGVMLRCLWHDERTPSCIVTDRDRAFPIMAHCFGCGANHNVFGLIAEVHGLDKRRDFTRVLDLAADYAGVVRPDRSAPRDMPHRQRVCRPTLPEELDDGVMDRVATTLARIAPITNAPWAMDYLSSRGLDCAAARSWYALPDGAEREALRLELVSTIGWDVWNRSGLGSENERQCGRWSYSWHGARVVIPWRSPNGAVDVLQARAVAPGVAPADKYKFPRGRRPRWPFGVEVLHNEAGPDTTVAVVEGAIDAISLNILAVRHGVDLRAVGLPGAAAWDDRWYQVFARRPVVVALDDDKTGQERGMIVAARLQAVARRGPRGPLVSWRKPSRGKDWNALLCAQGVAW